MQIKQGQARQTGRDHVATRLLCRRVAVNAVLAGKMTGNGATLHNALAVHLKQRELRSFVRSFVCVCKLVSGGHT